MAVRALGRFNPGAADDRTWIGVRPWNSLASLPTALLWSERR
jgi:hypothetical protein